LSVPARPFAAQRGSRAFTVRLFGSGAATVGLAIVLTMVLLALFAPLVAPYDYDQDDLVRRLAPPVWAQAGSWEHPLGTDSLGRDILSRLVYGARVSLGVAGTAVIIAAVIGILLGLVAGYSGGWFDALIMR